MSRRKKRDFSVFSMSFLDIMSCGFGAVILFFVIIQHSTEVRTDDLTADISGEVMRMETEVKLEQLNRVKIRNSLDEVQFQVIEAEGRSERVLEDLTITQEELSEQDEESAARREHVNQLITDIQSLEEELKALEAEEGGEVVRSFFGEGDRQYLTGLRMGGQRILVLVDSSASMLDATIVNIIRRRYLPDEQKIRAEKWQKALVTVDWLSTQFPKESQFQIYTFNTQAKPVLTGTRGQWLEIGEGRKVDEAVNALRKIVPDDGSRLHAAAEAIMSMSPPPDNIYLLVDSLPTQGKVPDTGKGTVDSRRRERYFRDAVKELPAGIPINVILFPMEGDPKASSEFWKLAVASGGSYLSPSKDWP